MKTMSSLDIYAITKELQGLLGYRVDNIYRDSTDTFFLFKFKGKGQYKNPFLLIEPGKRIHITEVKYTVPERPSDKIMALRNHLKGTEIVNIRQIDFDRLIELELKGDKIYRVYVEIFGTRPNFVVVGEGNRVIFALWYKKMRHRDILPGKEFVLPPSRGKSILNLNFTELKEIFVDDKDKNGEIVRTLAQKTGGGGDLMEEILTRAKIPKNKMNSEIVDEDIHNILKSVNELKSEIEDFSPSVLIDSNGVPSSFHPIFFKSVSQEIKIFDTFSLALDYYYVSTTPLTTIELSQDNRKKKKLLKVLEAQESAIKEYEEKKKRYKEIGDIIYLHFDTIDEILSTVRDARRKNVPWSEIKEKLFLAKKQGNPYAKIFENIYPDRGTISLNLNSFILEVDFRKSATDIATDYYNSAKKAARKIEPAKIAISDTQRKIELVTENISDQTILESISLRRRKRKWFEKYHWTRTQNGFLIIGGKDISSNEEIAKKRMKNSDYFFHAELRGAPYTVLVSDSSEKEITEHDINTAACLAAVFSSGWKAGYTAIDVYYVLAENVGFTAPSGEYIPKGGIMIRGKRSYINGVELSLAIGVLIEEFNATVIYGSKEDIRSISPITVIIKPGSIKKGKIAQQIRNIFLKKLVTAEGRAKIKAIDLNEFVQAVPYDSVISDVEYERIDDSNN